MSKSFAAAWLALVATVCPASALSQPRIIETNVAAPGVLAVTLQTESLETGENTQPDVLDLNVANWRVNGQAPTAIHRYSMPYDERPKTDSRFPVTVHHVAFLRLGHALIEGAVYGVTSPYGASTLTFSSRSTRCLALKVNQEGYSKRSTLRFGNLGAFFGDGGTMAFDPLPAYSVLNASTGTVVISGTGVDMGDDTGAGGTKSGERVYRLRLESLPEGGPYLISVPGCGVSRPFGVGDAYTRRIAYVATRGLYHQRCRAALTEPYTTFTRPVCHTQVFDTRTPWVQDPAVTVPSGTKTIAVEAGYHDAGDFDVRPMHVIIPIYMMAYAEAWPDHSSDGALNIPESGNGRSDFLDEAFWGVRVFETLQVMDRNDAQYGGVRHGVEMDRHPIYSAVNAATDPGKYGTWAVGEATTAWSAGLFAHKARLVRPYDGTYADALVAKARLAWDYLKRTSNVSVPKTQFMYAALQLYLATGEESFHAVFRDAATAIVASIGAWPEQLSSGNLAAACQIPHFASYLLNHGRPADAALVAAMKARVIRDAFQGGYHNVDVVRAPYPVGARGFLGWGGSTAQGRYADVYAWASLFTVDAAQRQTFVNAVSVLSDYALGLNPLSMSFYTGLGADQPQSPLHLDSFFTRQRGLPNVPGILIYGAGDNSEVAYEKAVWGKLFPSWAATSGLRQWAGGWSFVRGNEFSTHETILFAATMFHFLNSPGGVQPVPPVTQNDAGTPGSVVDAGTADSSVRDASAADAKRDAPAVDARTDSGVDSAALICIQPPVICGPIAH